jgi:hypothetical protein
MKRQWNAPLPRVDKIIKHDRIFPHGLACQIPQQNQCAHESF